MLSASQEHKLKRSSAMMEVSGTAKALTAKELMIAKTLDFSVLGGGTREVTKITCVADDTSSLTGTYFSLYDEAGSVGVWIDVDNAGETIPAGANAAARAIEVTTVTEDMTAAQVAGVLATAINADSKFIATASDAVVTVTVEDPEVVANATDGTGDAATGFTFVTFQEGITNINLAYIFQEDVIVTKVLSHEITNVTSGGSATVALRADSTAIVAATAIATFTGVVNHTLSGSVVGIPVSKGAVLNVDVEVAALTAGKVRFYIYAVPQRDIG